MYINGDYRNKTCKELNVKGGFSVGWGATFLDARHIEIEHVNFN